MLDLVRKSISIPCGKVAKLCLVTMSSYLAKQHWKVSEFADLIGSEAKTVRVALKELVSLKLVIVVGQTDLNAYVYMMNIEALSAMAEEYAQSENQSDLARLSRQVQVHRTAHSKKPKPLRTKS
jgi:hypothetical protein